MRGNFEIGDVRKNSIVSNELYIKRYSCAVTVKSKEKAELEPRYDAELTFLN